MFTRQLLVAETFLMPLMAFNGTPEHKYSITFVSKVRTTRKLMRYLEVYITAVENESTSFNFPNDQN